MVKRTRQVDTMSAEEFQVIRKTLDLSQSQVAELLCVTRQQVSRWEILSGPSVQKVPPLAARAMRWFARGYRPDEWPLIPAGSKPGPKRKYEMKLDEDSRPLVKGRIPERFKHLLEKGNAGA